MAASFDEREKAFENKFKHDEEFRFRVQARAVKMFGRWVAGQLGITDAAAVEKYADEVMDADFDEPGIQDFLGKVKKDYAAKGIEVTAHHLENEYNLHLEKAKKEIIGK